MYAIEFVMSEIATRTSIKIGQSERANLARLYMSDKSAVSTKFARQQLRSALDTMESETEGRKCEALNS